MVVQCKIILRTSPLVGLKKYIVDSYLIGLKCIIKPFKLAGIFIKKYFVSKTKYFDNKTK